MKKLITIFLLLLMASHVTALYFSQPDGMVLVQTMEEEREKAGNEEKKDAKEYIAHANSDRFGKAAEKSFAFLQIAALLSPVIDHLTPPPDNA